jgi:hypothetical protein
MRSRILGIGLFCSLALGIAGCGIEEPPPRPDSGNPSLTGTWRGSIQNSDRSCPRGDVLVTLSHTGASVTGTWRVTFSNSTCNDGGGVVGSLDGTTLTARLGGKICPIRLTALRSGSDRLSGTYTYYNCLLSASGSVEITRQ